MLSIHFSVLTFIISTKHSITEAEFNVIGFAGISKTDGDTRVTLHLMYFIHNFIYINSCQTLPFTRFIF